MYIKKCIYSVGKTKTIRHLLFIEAVKNVYSIFYINVWRTHKEQNFLESALCSSYGF
jgi:hypothetical protein